MRSTTGKTAVGKRTDLRDTGVWRNHDAGSEGLRRWYINTTIVFLDIIHLPVFI
jgi:hypothetical protein